MLRTLYTVLTCLLSAAILMGCQNEALEPQRFSGQTMGTTWSVTLVPSPDNVVSDNLETLLQQRLDQINQLMSTYDPASEISHFNQLENTDWFPVSAETAEVVDLSLSVSRLTSGAFDISVGPLVDLWGFGSPARSKHAPDPAQVEQVMTSIGYEKLELRRIPPALRKKTGNLRIDLSAVAKGYAVDQLAELLKQRGIVNYLVEVGGELQVAGRRMDGALWRIAIEKPLEGQREVKAVIPLTGTALATSGNYRNFYIIDGQRYVHTINPVSGEPIRHRLASVTVLDPSCARADALATALMVLGEEKGRNLVERYQLPVLFLIHNQDQLSEYISPEFKRFTAKISP